MSNNGKDTSGNSFKFSLIPLMLGIVLIFFLYRSCKNSVFQAEPQKNTTQIVEEETVTSERPIVKVDTLAKAATTVATDTTAVAKDTVQAAK
ncbi:hypothetical protein H1R17_06690 [Flavobacterium sp. xlx-214]|uniref:hypothetical protein n=1 Tax=unclassified Flavobacterium TaxID=196869 RepID=UPI0013D09AAE|nr:MULTISPECIES: hypothetical protein [unclassified Flavobacterium]MBA5792862.1 hypothetical protein [Flavobacterium sp. xlx-221]QMI84803.1 hypothetical protein H1R17_06690 [Flavobacterium sp. xlx-214]